MTRVRLPYLASLALLAGLATACAQPLGSAPLSSGGGEWTGGTIGQACDPQTQGEGCAVIDGVIQVVTCGASGVWTGKEPCLNGGTCAEQAVDGSTKHAATCVGGNVAVAEDGGSSGNDDGSGVLDGISVVDSGASKPDSGASKPDSGASKPDSGASKPDSGSTKPDSGASAPDSGSTQPDAGGGTTTLVPLPTIELKDFNPGSPTGGQMVKLDQFAGKYVVVLMGAGWCASCNAQADFLEKIKFDLEKKGRDDFVMITLNDKSAADANNQKLMYTCDYGAVCPAKGKPLSYPVLQGTAKYGWTTFIDTNNGNVKGAKNDCFIYAKDGSLKFKHVGKPTVNLTQFDQEVRAALK